MTSAPVTLPADLPVTAALERSAAYPFTSFPVLDLDGQFVGLVSEARLRRTLAEDGGGLKVRALVDRRTPLFADQRLVEAVVALDQSESRQLAVVERSTPQRLAGILALSDIVRAQARVARSGTSVAGTMPVFSEARETLADQPIFRRLRPFSMRRLAPAQDDNLDLHYHTVQLAPDAPAAGQAVRALALPPGVLLVAIERAEQTIIPQGETLLVGGDRVTLVAASQQLAGALAALTGVAVEGTDESGEQCF